ncbi:hypothetical protein [Hymenobacter jeollabukensis]|uniref:Lipocalin-like domain-containing protein n=1 Tax=Hymenobacter jeollabukensis TaxID=2025313 RepID=A0A5R8WKM8_9BACT|nr:hypothetical protein [Hymenobacter jeollabukensis]TLM89440.1 hypothetical protein FDY95_20420 [Hymenobacter jeollabukensis]
MIRSRFVLGALASATVALGACKKDDAKPVTSNDQLLVAHEWRLSETRLNGQVTGSGATVKDQYDWHFVSGGSYHLTYLADASMVQGQWQVSNPNNLHVVDHKGDAHDYAIQQLDNTTLRLSWEERAGERHEDIYTAK